jgi:hypothetical protein
MFYIFVLMEIGSRRILHCNVTAHPTAEWTLQQFREGVPSDHRIGFPCRDPIFSEKVDNELKAFGLKILRTAPQAPKANTYCERLRLVIFSRLTACKNRHWLFFILGIHLSHSVRLFPQLD